MKNSFPSGELCEIRQRIYCSVVNGCINLWPKGKLHQMCSVREKWVQLNFISVREGLTGIRQPILPHHFSFQIHHWAPSTICQIANILVSTDVFPSALLQWIRSRVGGWGWPVGIVQTYVQCHMHTTLLWWHKLKETWIKSLQILRIHRRFNAGKG